MINCLKLKSLENTNPAIVPWWGKKTTQMFQDGLGIMFYMSWEQGVGDPTLDELVKKSFGGIF